MIKTKGFTIVELMVVLLIIVIIGLFTMPYLETAVINSKIRATAESLQNGFRKAQLAAASRNGTVQFHLTSKAEAAESGKDKNCDAISKVTVDNVKSHSDNGTYWTICTTADEKRKVSGTTDNLPVSQQIADGNALIAVEIEAPKDNKYKKLNDKSNYIEFRGMGGTNINTPQIFLIKSANTAWSCATEGGNVQCLKVILSPGGRSRVCNPMYDNVRDANNRINSMACKQS